MKNVTVGIVVLNYITWEDTKRCIMSIRNNIEDISYKIYLVDNKSPNRPEKKMLDFINNSKDIVFYETLENRGYSAGNNIGIKLAQDDNCEYILITNNDIIFQKNSINNMIDAFNIEKSIGIVGPYVLNHDGTLQKGTNFHEGGLKQKYLAETWLRKLYPKYRIKCFGSEDNYKEVSFVYSVSGCCFMFSKECAIKVTPLDENTFLYGEEEILGKAMELSGFKTLYYPKSEVIHKHGASTRYVKAFSYICRVNSELYYCKKYLRAHTLLIVPLYIIRSLSFIIHATTKKGYRNELKRYFRETWFSMWK